MRLRTSVALAFLVALATSGCYLAQIAVGQARLLRARQPIEHLLADPSTPRELRDRLVLIEEVREFAVQLGLDVGGQYTSFAPWPGDRVVTIVVATRPGELEPAGFRFPFIGRVPYKGFFDLEKAEAEATRLREREFDVCMVGVDAYSTLGWLDDPVTGPMIRREEGAIVETIVHELVHATLFVRDDADFNEGVASFIGEEGSVRFYDQADRPEQAQQRRACVRDERRINRELLLFREQVLELNATRPPGAERRAARVALERRFRDALGELPLETREPTAVAASLRLNDACLALSGTYSADSPLFEAKLQELGGDLRAFVARLRRAARQPDARAALLQR